MPLSLIFLLPDNAAQRIRGNVRERKRGKKSNRRGKFCSSFLLRTTRRDATVQFDTGEVRPNRVPSPRYFGKIERNKYACVFVRFNIRAWNNYSL